MQVITENNLAEILSAKQVALVDFWATWCGPCRILSPTVDDIAQEYEGKVSVAKCNVDDCAEIAERFGIRSIPTLIFFKDGEPVERTVGLVSRADIQQILDRLV